MDTSENSQRVRKNISYTISVCSITLSIRENRNKVQYSRQMQPVLILPECFGRKRLDE